MRYEHQARNIERKTQQSRIHRRAARSLLATGLAISCCRLMPLQAQVTRDEQLGVMKLQANGTVAPTAQLDSQLRAVFQMSDPPQGIYLPFRRKSNGAKPELSEKARLGLVGNAFKHPFGGAAGGSGGTIPFVVGMAEPKAYVGTQIVQAKYLMKPITYASLSASSHLPLLRVVVNPQTPVWGVNGGHHVLNVVIANEDQSTIIQPVLLKPFGVNLVADKVVPLGEDMEAIMEESNHYGGLNAVFRLSDVGRVRALSHDRTFYLIIIGSDNAKQVYKIDPSYFEQLGD